MRVVLTKDSPLGKAGQAVEVTPAQGRVLIATGQAREADWRKQVVGK